MTVRQLLTWADSMELTQWQAFYQYQEQMRAEASTGRHSRKW